MCLSASHIAFGSIRMEPVFMVLGQSAAVAACEAIDNKTAVQDVDIRRVQKYCVTTQRQMAVGPIISFM
ncbi:FAD-dependent oxidoreductase [Sphingobacterium sp. E70]|uniref:FAD-dependent oxidoreductase n=1 Tax=Sphingobacterium sp. E70 TaxID=2853439 RepID=UPI00211CFFF4|nr:FAD-dependent oxidoreductase [Sphingobacterium sp. E70]